MHVHVPYTKLQCHEIIIKTVKAAIDIHGLFGKAIIYGKQT